MIDVPVEVRTEEIVITQGDRRYRVPRAGEESQLRSAEDQPAGSHVLKAFTSTRSICIRRVSARCSSNKPRFEMGVKEEVIRHDIGRVLLQARRTAGRGDPPGA